MPSARMIQGGVGYFSNESGFSVESILHCISSILLLWKRNDLSVVLHTWSWCGKLAASASRSAESKRRAIWHYFLEWICYMSPISKCREDCKCKEDWDLRLFAATSCACSAMHARAHTGTGANFCTHAYCAICRNSTHKSRIPFNLAQDSYHHATYTHTKSRTYMRTYTYNHIPLHTHTHTCERGMFKICVSSTSGALLHACM